MTVEAIRALNTVDWLLIPRKGAAKAELAELRRAICERFLENPATRIVEFDMPERDAAGVEAWHAAIAAIWRGLLAGAEGSVGLLVWGDPALYDSTLRILDRLAADGLAFSRRVIPGITSLQALAARHAIPLNAIGGAVQVTTGRRLRAGVPDAEAIAVMLDAGGAFETVPAEDYDIFWGAYLGMPQEIAVAGPLAEVGGRIAEARAAARAEHGWIMDVYLLRRR